MSAVSIKPRVGKPRVILLEDSQILSEIMNLCILNWFWDPEVLVFEDGDAAWQELARSEPDLFITDWLHPGADGGELLRRLAERQVKFPVMVVSGEMTSIPDQDKLGIAVSFLPKPFNRQALWQVLNHLVGPCDWPARLIDLPLEQRTFSRPP